jgi:nuclease-like protein
LAYIIPSDITRLALSGAHSPELETLSTLKSQLPPDYTVFHGVHWTREYQGGTVYGEIDFVVLNRSGDVLFIEQKNGPLEETEAGLVKRYDEGTRNVAEQLHRSLDRVRQKFQWQHGKARALEADYLVYCPDYRVQNVNAVGLDATRIVDARDRDRLAQRIQSILGSGVRTGEGWYQKVYDFFCQSFQVVPDIHARISA